MIIDKLIEKIEEKNNATLIGLDTCASYLPNFKEINDNETAGKEIFEFNKNIIDATSDIIPAIKVQIAYYEMYGIPGLKAFADTINYAKQKGLITIADIKRNDIASTAKAYSNAFLGKNDIGISSIYSPDFVTINGYLGSDGINPFIEDCLKNEKGLFVLVRTSNPSSKQLQCEILQNGKNVYEKMAELVVEWGEPFVGKYGYNFIGAVVGGTHKEECSYLREKMKKTFFLIPGYGKQGGSSEMLKGCFDRNGIGGIVNSSRGIICAYKQYKYSNNYAEAALQSALDMKNDINKAIGR